MPLTCPLKNGENGQLCYVHFIITEKNVSPLSIWGGISEQIEYQNFSLCLVLLSPPSSVCRTSAPEARTAAVGKPRMQWSPCLPCWVPLRSGPSAGRSEGDRRVGSAGELLPPPPCFSAPELSEWLEETVSWRTLAETSPQEKHAHTHVCINTHPSLSIP